MDADEFWKHIDKTDACWNWTGPVGKNGYGSIHWGGRSTYPRRVSWEIAKGPIPPRTVVSATCGNKLCVRPEHLELARPAVARSGALLKRAREIIDIKTDALALAIGDIDAHSSEYEHVTPPKVLEQLKEALKLKLE